MERLSPVHWGVKQMRLYYTATGKQSWYPHNWEQLAEDEGYFLWTSEFLGSYNEYKRLERYTDLADEMFGKNYVFFETGEEQLFVVFDSASDAFRFRFELAERA